MLSHFSFVDSCGTCSLAPQDKGGVVDARLKVRVSSSSRINPQLVLSSALQVYGTKNIRVSDLSILPLITVVHTQGMISHSFEDRPGLTASITVAATTYGIAEQGSCIYDRICSTSTQ